MLAKKTPLFVNCARRSFQQICFFIESIQGGGYRTNTEQRRLAHIYIHYIDFIA